MVKWILKGICGVMGHPALPTGRQGYLLVEWRCLRCGQRLVSHKNVSWENYGIFGIIFPVLRYEGLSMPCFTADEGSDRIMEDERCHE